MIDIGSGHRLNLTALLGQRLLVQAMSGAGKSWFLRRLLEQSHGQVQHLVIDPEGEFASLRAKFDYVLVAKHGGDTLADPRSAKLLAERLLELGVNAVLDIYELPYHQRIDFVKVFLETLVDAPKKLWHPALVVLDESHVYAPQRGEAASAPAVIDLATRGRKRGFCLVAATQRLSKLHKDCAAEMGNKLIGRTTLDVDLQRAADEIGMGKARWQEIQSLKNGEFFAYGPAFNHVGVEVVMIGGVQTEHPKSGSHKASTVPPASEKIRAILAKITDLPAEAERKAKSEADLKKENAELKRKLTIVEKTRPVPAGITEAERKLFTSTINGVAGNVTELQHRLTAFSTYVDTKVGGLRQALDGLTKFFAVKAENAQVLDHLDSMQRVAGELVRSHTLPVVHRTVVGTVTVPLKTDPVPLSAPYGTPAATDSAMQELSNTQRRIIETLHMLKARGLTPNREMLARWLAIHPNGGRFGQDLARLRKDGYLKDLTPTVGDMGDWDTTYQAMINALPDETKRTIVSTLKRQVVDRSRDDLAKELGIHPNGGRFGQDLVWLRTMGVVPDRGWIYLTEAAGD